MKKILLLLILNLFFCNFSLADNYYFKGCKINEIISADYIINFEKNVIEVNLNNIQEDVTQKIEDEIKLIEEDKITSKVIQSGKGSKNYFQYYLNSKSNSIIKQEYTKVGDIFRLSGPIRETFCLDVKAGWDKRKIEETDFLKQQEEVKKTQEIISEEQSALPECEGNNLDQWTNCQSVYTTENGSKYNGFFQNGQIVRGTVNYPGGGMYVGNFQLYKPNGQGTFTYADGTIHSGNWKNGKGHGQGIKTWMDGKKYEGEFKNDEPHGSGTFIYLDGSKYTGEFISGKKHGQGTLQYPDGTAYIGKFVGGLEHGQGVCVDISGDSINCTILKSKNKKSSESSKNRKDISIEAKKWIKITDYESSSGKGKKIMDKLEKDFSSKALELCASTKNFVVLEKKINVLEVDETPSFGTTAKVKLGIQGVVECK